MIVEPVAKHFRPALGAERARHLAHDLVISGPENIRAWHFVADELRDMPVPLKLRSGRTSLSPLGLMAEWCRRARPRRWVWCGDLIVEIGGILEFGETSVRIDGVSHPAWEYTLPPRIAEWWGLDAEAESLLHTASCAEPEAVSAAIRSIADVVQKMTAPA